ncbi:hypothetical protein DSO57_1031857 [Entomophthora muscae]|uniref:Uncharacterized protein n=1 Tax=Entomophthora muscae TaxID=34485 RepID=A0ACC2SPM7_9FUNG|nr:hypothetical protein DSO57_1031857 [Entomophthora muscae]
MMTSVKTWNAGELDPKVSEGDTVSRYGNRFLWTSNHMTGRQMLPMTMEADPLADEAIALLKGRGVQAILDSIDSEKCPPQIKRLHEQITNVPEWVDMDQILRGQEFYWETFHDNGRVLMNHSLISDFAVSSIVRVLTCTGNLANPKSAYRRGAETAYMVSSAMERGQLSPGGRGWTSVVGVRLMHAQARIHATRISQRTNKSLLGVAINQQDLMFTLLLFSVTVILGYEKLGVKFTTQQRDDYMATFRYVGYLLGIQDPNNIMASFDTALAMKQSLDVYLIQPNKESAHMTKVVLKSFEKNPPFFLSFRHHVQTARLLMGDALANELQLPHANTGLDLSLKLTMYRQNKMLDLMLRVNRQWGLSFLERKVLEAYRILLKGDAKFQFSEYSESQDYSVNAGPQKINPYCTLLISIPVLATLCWTHLGVVLAL